jgi:hypothetical protein
VLALGTYTVLSGTVLHGSVDAHSLSKSVERVVDVGSRVYDDGYGCEQVRGSAAWECVIPDSDSGIVGYRVAVRPGTSCWDARILATDRESMAGMPKTASGCVRRWEWGL